VDYRLGGVNIRKAGGNCKCRHYPVGGRRSAACPEGEAWRIGGQRSVVGGQFPIIEKWYCEM